MAHLREYGWDLELKEFVLRHGEPYSRRLGIDLASGKPEELAKWFLASILYAKPIREESATKTYKAFEAHGILSPSSVVETGWDGLVAILDEGGYTRYDFSTADKLLEVFQNLKERYGGDLGRLHREAEDPEDLESRLMALGKGIGPTTVAIFLRDLRGIWTKAKPKPTPLVRLAMEWVGIEDLEASARAEGIDPVWLETALSELARLYLKRGIEPPLARKPRKRGGSPYG